MPLHLDRELFRGVFGVVTWHACRKVQSHYDTTIKPYMECTGTFTRVTGLPCAHVYDEKRHSGGFTPLDFHKHWLWNWRDPRVPYRDPVTLRAPGPNIPTARNTGRILSAFEQVEQQQQRRAPPKCTACQGVGHTRTSRNCLIRLCASIAEDSWQLREQELLQASNTPVTPRPAKRIRLEIPDSASTSISEQNTPFSLRIRPQNSESPLTLRNQLQGSENTASPILDSPRPVFQAPPLIPGVEYPMTSPIREQPQPSLPIQAEPPPLEVFKPLHHERIEMAILLY